MSIERVRRHPAIAYFEAFKQKRHDLFEGKATGIYLDNRLNVAFSEGWNACVRQLKIATGEE